MTKHFQNCEPDRVPQYDLELKLAEKCIRDWKRMAERLYQIRGCRKNEKRRLIVELEYLKLKTDHENLLDRI